ncbi:hypothetical protein MNBD_GAMMA18-2164 [hydrothermal vent metagenome]|uniref:Cytochrome c domain-containing protein n=1 Tax=hydrothermal vent metagenome TaxID=652676 RepID=A0A3B0ZUC8_9ZZZZ
MQKSMLLIIIITTSVTACIGRPLLPSQTSNEFSFYQAQCGNCHEPVAAEQHYDYQWERLFTLIENGLELQHPELKPPSQTDKVRLLEYLQQFAYADAEEERRIEKAKEDGLISGTWHPQSDSLGEAGEP